MWLPQKCKAYILPCFGAILRFYQQFNCKIYVWRWYEPNLIFPGNIYGAFSGKKNQIPLCPCEFLQPRSVDKTLRFCSRDGLWHLINVEQNVSHVSDFCPNNTILLIFYGNNHYDIHLIVQLSHKGNSKLLKIFIKSISLRILGCNYGFFKKNKIFVFSYGASLC